VLDEREQAEILGINIDAIVFGERESGLEFARQIDLAIDRLGGGGIVARQMREDLAVEPDVVIGAAARGKAIGNRLGKALHLLVDGVGVRRGRRHHVALHVAAGAERRQQTFVDGGNGMFEVGLQHAMQLNALPRRDAQRAVGVGLGNAIEREILVRRDPASGNSAADHEDIRLARTVAAPVVAGIAVVLLIAAMKFDELFVLVVEAVRRFDKLVSDGSAQVLAVLLEQFNGGTFRTGGDGRRRWDRHELLVECGDLGKACAHEVTLSI
jgi:hypothetical protein